MGVKAKVEKSRFNGNVRKDCQWKYNAF